ncbi:adenylosuccinate synthetase, partial [Genlisea aurea]
MFAWDEGACMAPKEVWNGVMLVHWGNTNKKHRNSTTAYDDDNWDSIPQDLRGNHSCFDPVKDIVLPAWKSPYDISFGINKLRNHSRYIEERFIFFYFNGNLGPAYNGRPEERYSMGIRQKIGEEFGSTPNKEGKLGKQWQEDVMVLSKRSDNYQEELSSSIFCGVFPGDGWSGRMEDSILHGCIPVIIQDGIYLPYENVFDLESFGVRISEDDIPNMIRILRNISETEIERKQMNLMGIFQRFLYRDPIVLEAERQKHDFGLVEDWAVQFSQLKEDDVFATLVQILHYKLHNDEWRKEFESSKSWKHYGVPAQCVV